MTIHGGGHVLCFSQPLPQGIAVAAGVEMIRKLHYTNEKKCHGT